MAYLGVPQSKLENLTTNVQIVNLSASFDGTTVTFNLQDSRGDAIYAVHERALLVTLGGVTQKPGVDYTTSGTTITFTTAPVNNLTIEIRKFYGVQRIIGVNDGVISPVKLSTGGPVWNSSGNVTISGDLNVTGAFNSGGNGLFWEDNEKANFGSGNDLKIFHNSTASFIQDTGTGPLYIEGNEITIKEYGTGTIFTTFNSTGVGIGTDTPTDKLSILSAPNSLVIGCKDSTRTNHVFQLLADDPAGNGEIRLYTNAATGTHAKTVEIAASGNSYFTGGSIGIGTDAPDNILHIKKASNTQLKIETTSNTSFGMIKFAEGDHPNGKDKYIIGYNDSHSAQADQFSIKNQVGDITFMAGGTDTTDEVLRISSDGKVGINQTSPSEKLEIYAGDILLSNNAVGSSGGTGPNVALKFEYNGHQYAKIVGNGRDSSGYGDIDFYTSTSAGVTNLTQKMTIRADGKVGIGTDTPNSALSIKTNIDYSVDGTEFDDSASVYLVNDHSGSNVYTYSESAIVLAGRNSVGSTKRTAITGGGSGISFFVTENQDLLDVPAARFTGNGRLLLGAQTNRVYSTTVNPFLQIEGTEYHNAALSITRNSNDGFGSYLILAKSRGTSLGGTTKLEDDDIISEIRFAGADDVDMSNIASVIRCKVDGSVSSDTLPGLIQFQTNQGSGLTDRLSISSSGQILTAGAQTVPLASTGGIDLCSGLYSVVIGGNSGGGSDNITRTNNNNKEGRLTSAPYTNSEEPVSIATVFNRSSENLLYFGGGSSLVNAATKIGFYTAANTTTTGGTERLHITPGGSIGIGTDTPQAKLHIANGDLWISQDTATSGTGKPTIFFSEAAPNSNSSSMFLEYDGDGQANENNRLTIATPNVTISQFFHDGKMRLGGGSGRPSGHLDVQGDDGLFIKSGTNNPTNGAYLRFSDHQTDNFSQFGWIKYKHSDGQIYSGSNDGFIIGGSEINTMVKIDGQLVVNEPDARLILSATRGSGHVWTQSTSGTNAESFEIFDTTGSQRAFLYGSQSAGSTNKGWSFYTNGTADRLRIDNNGNVGIGINNPTAKLHVNGDLKTNDLILSNLDNPTGGNEVDGTRGHWCIQEGEDDLYILNRLNGKRYKMLLTEV